MYHLYSMRHIFFFTLLIAAGIFALGFSVSKKSDAFSPDFIKIAPEYLPNENYPIPQETLTILNQPFYFLGSGHQSYAFVSQDGNSVLKLVKFHCLTTCDPYQLIPRISFFEKIREKRDQERQRKIARVFQGYSVAYNLDRENCGLLCYHLPGSGELPRETVVFDKAGKKHVLDLNQYVFALQRKAIPTGELLKKVLNQGDLEQAQVLISSLFAMFEQELKAGLYDADHNVIHNTGFFADTPIRIDFGKLTTKDHIDAKKELTKIADERINPWLKHHFPEACPKISIHS